MDFQEMFIDAGTKRFHPFEILGGKYRPAFQALFRRPASVTGIAGLDMMTAAETFQ